MTDPQTALTDETGRVIFRGTQSPGGGSQPAILTAEFLFTEVADSATYSASLPVLAGTTVLDIILYPEGVSNPGVTGWAADFPCSLKIGDSTDPRAYGAIDLGTITKLYAIGSDAVGSTLGDTFANLGNLGNGFYAALAWNESPLAVSPGGPGVRYTDADEITLELITVNAVPVTPAGITRAKVIYALPATVTDAVVT